MNYNIGDKVDLSRWDKFERPINKLGDCEVIGLMPSFCCESGLMVKVRNPEGREAELDSNWLAHVLLV